LTLRKNNQILIADEMHPSLSLMLQNAGFVADYQPFIKRNEILNSLKNYVGIIIRSKTNLDKAFFDAAENLRFVGRAGAGMDLIDLEEAKNKNIFLLNAPEGNRDAVGEHVLGMLLMLFNKLNWADQQVRAKIWHREANRGVEIKGKTIALIGYGNNGMATAKKLSGFDCKVLAYDLYKENYSDDFAKEASLETIFEEADILSLHLPLTEVSRNLINADFIARFKKPFYLINAARGEIADLGAIANALDSKKILGACLDVLENEKLENLTPYQNEIFERLSKKENVLFSPHVAGWTTESYIRINEVLVEKIKNLNLV
jgi:D-3-phosphoglycerate dehydrogenase / 2-oxoglutarate reductase